MGDIDDFKAFQEELSSALLAVTKTTAELASEDLGFQRSLNREVGPALDEQSERILGLANALLKSAASVADLRVPRIEEVEDVDNDWRGVVDVVDSLLEKADTALYEYTGVIKRMDNSAIETTTTKPRKNTTASNPLRTQNLVKPQLAFEVKPDNFDTSPWKPLLTTKPYATLPLEESLTMITNELDQPQYEYSNLLPHALLSLNFEDQSGKKPNTKAQQLKRLLGPAMLAIRNNGHAISGFENGHTDIYGRYRHPYEHEILHMQYPESVYTKAGPIPYQPVGTTSATWVDTWEGVLEMLEELKTATEIAVDLEHHDHRSYIGLVSLMQISTREKDWIVDTLKPWRHKLEVLNEVFADPSIIKVFHGAFMDMVWLQRDLGLYVVGLFDTHYACRGLGYEAGSLAFLLKKFINFDADKKYQMADWRIRPLPEEMFFYARSDTHFLLYIYDNVRNELIDRSKKQVPAEDRLEIVLQKSKETALLRYERSVYDSQSGKGAGGWFNQLVKIPALFSKEQFSVFRAVHEWRDKIAREDDDSTAFVMPNHVLMSISKHMPQDLVALTSVATPISHNVKSRSSELLEIIKTANANGSDGPTMMEILKPDSVGAVVKANLPHVAKSKESTPLSTYPEVDETELRSNRSSFWGGAFGSSIWESPASTKDQDDGMRLAIPFPALVSEINTSATNTPAAASPQINSTPHSPSPTPDLSSQAFTLRRGADSNNTSSQPALKKRKVQNGDGQAEPASNSISLEASSADEDSEDDQAAAKRARKAARKQAKAEKRALKAQQNSSNPPPSFSFKPQPTSNLTTNPSSDQDIDIDMEENDDNQPFDYAAAPKISEQELRRKEKRKREKGKGVKGGKGGEVNEESTAGWDPYEKSMDAAKGMRRVQGERTGRSGVWKN